MTGARAAGIALVGALVLAACTGPASSDPAGPATPVAPEPSSEPAAPPRATVPAAPTANPLPAPDAAAMQRTVRDLARGIGPREASSAAYRRAADLVAGQLSSYGYVVTRQRVPVPAGVSWGVPVTAGDSWNLVAVPRGFRLGRPHRVVGAHLDTVPQAPGAEDNASGVAVLLELARLLATDPPAVPVVLVVFGAEEPRGPGDALHHFGSTRYVQRLTPRQRAAIAGMVSLDRVGVRAAVVPACYGGAGSSRVRTELVAAARRADVPVTRCVNRASDHWSFEKAGIAAARLGSVPYAGYHSPGDLPRFVDDRQLRRVALVVDEWVRQD